MDEPMESFDAGDSIEQNHALPSVIGSSNTTTTGIEQHFYCNLVKTNESLAGNHSENITTGTAAADVGAKNAAPFTPLLRPGSMVMMTLTEEDYQNQYWPKLKTAIDQLLNMTPGSYSPISYEQMYRFGISCVYKCVCKQFSERLYNDLLNHLSSHMDHLNSELKRCENNCIPFIETFSFLMHQYMHALSGIVPIFNYMNRFYVENKLKSDLNVELKKPFCEKVVDTNIIKLLGFVDEISTVPFAIAPPTMASLVKNLYALNKDYSRHNPAIFSRYLPNILPPTDPSMLEQYAEEARKMQENISSMAEFRSRGSSNKRVFEDDISVN